MPPPFQPQPSPGPPPASPLQIRLRWSHLAPAGTQSGRRWSWSAAARRRFSVCQICPCRHRRRTLPESHPKCFASEQDPADSASPRQCKPYPQQSLLSAPRSLFAWAQPRSPLCRADLPRRAVCPPRLGSLFLFVGAQHRCALPAQANPPQPPSATADALESPCEPPPHKAQTGCSPPPPYENYNTYTSSGRTAPARKSRPSSSPKNSSTPPPRTSQEAPLTSHLSSRSDLLRFSLFPGGASISGCWTYRKKR